MLTPRMRNPILAAVILGLVCAFSAVGAGINPEPAEIKCSVDSDRPQLFFDFRLHVPFVVEIPRKQLAGPENRLRIRIQVTPISPAKKPVELNSEMRMPALEEARGGLEFSGSLAVGLGRYDVRWSLEDEFGRTCTVRWEIEGGLDKKNRHVQLAIAPGEVGLSGLYTFRRLRRVDRIATARPLRVKVLVNFSPMSRRRSSLRSWEVVPLASMLRQLAERREFSEFSVVAFSLEDQKVFFRQDYESGVRLPSLGRAIGELSPGTVALDELGKGKELDFLGRLLVDELAELTHADAVIVLSPKQPIWDKIDDQILRSVQEALDVPLFYLSFNPFPNRNPWRDSIGSAVKGLKGQEIRVSEPGDVPKAIYRIVSAITNLYWGEAPPES